MTSSTVQYKQVGIRILKSLTDMNTKEDVLKKHFLYFNFILRKPSSPQFRTK